jgi:hypothetical protein
MLLQVLMLRSSCMLPLCTAVAAAAAAAAVPGSWVAALGSSHLSMWARTSRMLERRLQEQHGNGGREPSQQLCRCEPDK